MHYYINRLFLLYIIFLFWIVKNIIKKIDDDELIDDSKNIYDQINLRKFYSNAVKRCEDRRNLPSFAEIAQFEIKDWILQYIFRKYLKIYNIIDSFSKL